MIDRILRAIRLDAALYREVADDPQFNMEAVVIVVVVAALSALGTGIAAQRFVIAFFAELASSLILGWLLWALISYLIGAALGGRSSLPEMARTLGYANSPRLLALLGFIPCVGWVFRAAGWILGIAAGVIAIRESMEFDTFKAIVTAVVGLILYVVASGFINLTLGGLGISALAR